MRIVSIVEQSFPLRMMLAMGIVPSQKIKSIWQSMAMGNLTANIVAQNFRVRLTSAMDIVPIQRIKSMFWLAGVVVNLPANIVERHFHQQRM